MFKRLSLFLIVVLTLMLAGCLIKGRVVDQNGAGVAGVTITLSGYTSMTTTTDSNGDYQFGTLDNLLTAGSYTVTPSGDFIPESRDITINSITIENGVVVPWPVTGVSFSSINFLDEEEQSFLTNQELSEIVELDISQLIAKGLTLLNTHQVLKSEVYFKVAWYKSQGIVSNDADTARFFYTITRVAAVVFDIQADENDEGLHDFGDILDAFGVGVLDRDLLGETGIVFPTTLPNTSPSGADLQDFLYNVVRPELIAAVETLDEISPSFNKTWSEPIDNTSVESDYGDVLTGKALLKCAISIILIQYAYDLDFDVAALVNTNVTTIETFLSANTKFFTLGNSIYLQNAKTYIGEAANDIESAIDTIQTETDGQLDDLVTLADMSAEEILEAKEAILALKQALKGSNTTYDEGTDSHSDDTIFNISPFFSGINLRSLLPSFSDDDPIGLLPDTSFGGILLQLEGLNPGTLNEDANANGTADIFE